MRILIFILLLTGCASKFAPVVSRPDNLIIDCPTGCKFNIPMNTEIVVAKNTNGYDMGISLIRQIPFLGALALSWKSMETAEDIAEHAIESFDRGAANVTNTTTTTTVGDTTTTGDTSSTVGDTGSGNSSTTATTGDTVDSSGSGNTSYDNDIEYNNSLNTTDNSNNSVNTP